MQHKFTEQLERVDLIVDALPTLRIVRLDVQPVARPADLEIPRLPEAAAVAALSERADSAAAAGEFSGVLLVSRKGRLLLNRAWGYGERETRTPITLDTPFDIASVEKMFIAVATLQLVEAGRLNLDDTVGARIPKYANKEFASKVTIPQQLTSTG